MKRLLHFEWNYREYAEALVKDSESIAAAFSEWGLELPVTDDGSGPVWFYQNDDHFRCVVRAESFEDALEAVYDTMPTVPEEDIHEAYGFEGRSEFDALVDSNPDEYPELAECFHYQANASGTGIIFAGYSEHLAEINPKGFEDLRISLLVEEDER